MDKLPKDNHDSIDATWLMEEPYLDIIPEDPPQETEILYCQCKKPSSVYQESNDLGHWLKCGDCNRVIKGSLKRQSLINPIVKKTKRSKQVHSVALCLFLFAS